MSRRTPNQDKALVWYVGEHKLKPQLSTHPVYYFVDKNGNEQKVLMAHMMADWERMRLAKKKKVIT